MDTEQADEIDIGVEKLSENFSRHVSLANSVVGVAEPKGALETEECQKNESKEGDCYIFDYQEFELMEPRGGSEKDSLRLQHDFTQLKFDVHVHVNLSYKETFKALKKASKKDYSKKKYFVCCFLTHGGENGGLWARDLRMNIDDILEIFSKSPSLKEIPKIFIIQACQGTKAELAVSLDCTDGGSSTDTEVYPDFLIVNSTYLDTVSFRDSGGREGKCHGSFFIDEFCRSLEDFCERLDLLKILTFVNYRMATTFLSHFKDKDNKKLNEKKQMPCFTSTLRRKIKFDIKKNEFKPFKSPDTEWFDKRRKRHGSGDVSTEYPLSDIKEYYVEEAKRVFFLPILYENYGKNDVFVRSAIQSLKQNFRKREYSHVKFESNFEKNLNISEIFEFLNQGPKKAKESSRVDCLICYIAAYSIGDIIYDANGMETSKKEIVEKFIKQEQQPLKLFVGKPKVFIFLLRKLHPGERFYKDVEPFIEPSISAEYINSSEHACSRNTESNDAGFIGENSIPVHADILEICITVKNWKHIIGPMNAFCKLFEKRPNEELDLISLLTEFNSELVEKHNFFQTSKNSFSLTSTLTKFLYLP